MIRSLLPVVVAVAAVGCAGSAPFALRGELDRERWVVRDCRSDAVYRVVFPSQLLFEYFEHEEALGASDPSVPVVFEFVASPLGPKMPWNEFPPVSVQRPMKVARGTCAGVTDPAGSPAPAR